MRHERTDMATEVIVGSWRVSRFVLAAFVLMAVVGCDRFALDRKMAVLCKQDTGVKVYETVTLSPEQYFQTIPAEPVRVRGLISAGRLQPDHRTKDKTRASCN